MSVTILISSAAAAVSAVRSGFFLAFTASSVVVITALFPPATRDFPGSLIEASRLDGAGEISTLGRASCGLSISIRTSCPMSPVRSY